MTLQFRGQSDMRKVRVDLVGMISSNLPHNRSRCVERAFKLQATHILWLDTDMRFPPDTLFRLLGRKKPIVGANYRARNPPVFPTAVKGLKRVDTLEESTGVE